MVRIHSHDYQEQGTKVTQGQKDPGAWRGKNVDIPLIMI